MSELKLNAKLFDDIFATLRKHDENAEDYHLALKYLGAIVGYFVGQQDISLQDKQNYMEDVFGFAHHVMIEIEKKQKGSKPLEDSAPFGKWVPESTA